MRLLLRLRQLAVPVGMVVSAGAIYHASTAAFTGTTSTSANHWQAGTVSLSDDDGSTAMFNATGLTPSSSGSHCIVVTYTGNVPSTVALYGTSSGNLAQYVNLTVQTGTGRTFADGDPCGALTGSTQIYSGSLAGFSSANSNFATGAPTTSRWAPSANGTTRVYRFAYTIANDQAAQGEAANASFTWEAQSS